MGLWVWEIPEGASLCPSNWSRNLLKDYSSCSKRDTDTEEEEEEVPSLSFPTAAIAELRKKKGVHHSYGPMNLNLHACSKDSYEGTEKTSLLFDQENRGHFQSVNESHFHFTPETYTNSVNARSKQMSAV